MKLLSVGQQDNIKSNMRFGEIKGEIPYFNSKAIKDKNAYCEKKFPNGTFTDSGGICVV